MVWWNHQTRLLCGRMKWSNCLGYFPWGRDKRKMAEKQTNFRCQQDLVFELTQTMQIYQKLGTLNQGTLGLPLGKNWGWFLVNRKTLLEIYFSGNTAPTLEFCLSRQSPSDYDIVFSTAIFLGWGVLWT